MQFCDNHKYSFQASNKGYTEPLEPNHRLKLLLIDNLLEETPTLVRHYPWRLHRDSKQPIYTSLELTGNLCEGHTALSLPLSNATKSILSKLARHPTAVEGKKEGGAVRVN